MMVKISIKKLNNETIICLAESLGCKIPYPVTLTNKYLKELWKNSEDITDELKVKIENEN